MSGVVYAALVPGLPHLLARDSARSWRDLADAARTAREEIERLEVDALLMMSTQWFTVLGHQFQARDELHGTYVDENWYDFEYGTFDYLLRTHSQLTREWARRAESEGFQARLCDYDRFPVDTGTLVARKLLDPDESLPIAIMSCNLYVEPEEMESLARAGAAAAADTGLRVAAVAVTGLSGGWINRWITPAEDRISDDAHDAWNRKMLELVAGGDAAGARAERPRFAVEAEVDSQFRALDFLIGATDGLPSGELRAYGPVWGTGAAVVTWPLDERS
jgi:2-aminophenol/2-amino-5-chlorophenol 1,6-dioxygenase alpha subunit